jgi:hypothetical protein
MTQYWTAFAELIVTPFRHAPLIWGIVPLYFGWLLNELTSAKANFRTAIQTGFSFLWAAAQWIYPYFKPHGPNGPRVEWDAMLPINLLVTLLVLALGATALFSGIRRRYPRYCSFLGRNRFGSYLMITIFPMQTHYLNWSWERLAAIALFAVPVWLALHFAFLPIRNRK